MISSSTDVRESVEFGVTYWPSDVGPYLWHEFDASRVRADLRAMSGFGVRVVRTLLAWDAFMPTPQKVADGRLREFETLLSVADEASLRVVPVLFAHALGDCVMLPTYAIDVSRPRRGVRVVTDAVVQPGGPRDQYIDPLMVDAATVWLDSLVHAFSGHPALAGWDIGHDAASVIRPRRIDDMRRWAHAHAARLHDAGERCLLTFGTRDLTDARGVRPGLLAAELDGCGLAVDPTLLRLGTDDDAQRAVFLVQMMERFIERDVALTAHVSLGRPQRGQLRVEEAAAAAAKRARRMIDGLIDIGCAGLFAHTWSNAGQRVHDVAPFDRNPQLGKSGLVEANGEPTTFGSVWRTVTAREHERRAREIWPVNLDIGEYYANLPDSLTELYGMWQDVHDDHPVMLT